MKIAIFGSRHQRQHLAHIAQLAAALSSRNVEVWLDRRFYDYIHPLIPEFGVAGIIEGNDFDADYAISIGGDGTFLRTATRVGAKQIPIAGINTGHLGYLADVPICQPESFVDDLLTNNVTIDVRHLIDVTAEGFDYHLAALNELAIQKNASASMLHIHVAVDGRELTTYLGDGLIVSTPTGSTAYNLSVGGPIMHPACRSIVISPIAAHSLTMRPLVLPDDVVLEITTTSKRSDSFRASVDGNSDELPMGTTLRLSKADYGVHIVQHRSHDFADTLRKKLMWGADAR